MKSILSYQLETVVNKTMIVVGEFLSTKYLDCQSTSIFFIMAYKFSLKQKISIK